MAVRKDTDFPSFGKSSPFFANRQRRLGREPVVRSQITQSDNHHSLPGVLPERAQGDRQRAPRSPTHDHHHADQDSFRPAVRYSPPGCQTGIVHNPNAPCSEFQSGLIFLTPPPTPLTIPGCKRRFVDQANDALILNDLKNSGVWQNYFLVPEPQLDNHSSVKK